MNQYDNYISEALGDGEQNELKIRQFKSNYSFFFPKDQDVKCLDIGPGKGELLTCLSVLGYYNIEAVDISKSVAEYISQLGHKITLTDNLTSFLTEHKDTYSLITMCDVVEHIPKANIIEVISAVRYALKTGGIFIVQVPNMQAITANLFRYDDFTHEMGYTERSLIQMLSIAGFKDVQCYGFEMLGNGFAAKMHYYLRSLLWFFVKTFRKINGYMPHNILHPVFFAIVKK